MKAFIENNKKITTAIAGMFAFGLGIGFGLGLCPLIKSTEKPKTTLPTPTMVKTQKAAPQSLPIVGLYKQGIVDEHLHVIRQQFADLPDFLQAIAVAQWEHQLDETIESYGKTHHVIIMSTPSLLYPLTDITPEIVTRLNKKMAKDNARMNPVDAAWLQYCESPQFEARQNAHEQEVEESRNCMRVLYRSMEIEGEKQFDKVLTTIVPEIANSTILSKPEAK